jgi:hypothetical protein
LSLSSNLFWRFCAWRCRHRDASIHFAAPCSSQNIDTIRRGCGAGSFVSHCPRCLHLQSRQDFMVTQACPALASSCLKGVFLAVDGLRPDHNDQG